MKVSIASITITDRRREELGDIEGLAVSIAKYGLLHPIVIDDESRLVAGERRLRACKNLGWTEIDCRSLGELSESERREIELEENLRRKDLTADEQSKTLVRYVETVKQVAKEESRDLRTQSVRKPSHRPSEPGSYRDISERTGIPVATIRKAQQHVAAVDRYPELRAIPGLPQSNAITVAKNLDALPEEKREQKLEALRQYDVNTLAELAGFPPMPDGPSPQEAARNNPGVLWARALHKIQIFITGIRDNGGIEGLSQKWSKQNCLLIAEEMKVISETFREWETVLRRRIEDGAR